MKTLIRALLIFFLPSTAFATTYNPGDAAAMTAVLSSSLSCGDVIQATANVEYDGHFIFRNFGCTASNPIRVTTTGTIPPPGTRVDMSYFAQFPHFVTHNADAVFAFDFSASGWSFEGIAIGGMWVSGRPTGYMTYFLVMSGFNNHYTVAGTAAGYLINHAGGYPIGTTTLAIDTGSGYFQIGPSGDLISFPGNAQKYRVLSTSGFDPATTITITPGLVASVADNAALTFYPDWATDWSQLPTAITFDRVIFYQDENTMVGKDLYLNTHDGVVKNSRFDNEHAGDADSNCIMQLQATNTLIENNYLRCTGENYLAGGTDPTIIGATVDGLQVLRNYFTKNLAYKGTAPHAGNVDYHIKNIFELKNASNIRNEGNIYEYNWADGQDGSAILFTNRNQNGLNPTATIAHLIFRNNIVRHACAGIIGLGIDNHLPGIVSVKSVDWLWENILLYDISDTWCYQEFAGGLLMRFSSMVDDLKIKHITGDITGSGEGYYHNYFREWSQTSTGFVYEDILAQHGLYGFNGEDASGASSLYGKAGIDHYYPSGYTWNHFMLAGMAEAGQGSDVTRWPTGTVLISNAQFHASFQNASIGDYRVLPTSPAYRAGTNGADIGVNMCDPLFPDPEGDGSITYANTHAVACGITPSGPPLTPRGLKVNIPALRRRH